VSFDKLQSQIHVEVALAMPDRQEIVSLDMAAGSTVADAIEQSAILDRFPGFEFDPAKVGVFSSKVTMDQVLEDGDRVEIYRPLIADPKEVRRQRALKQAES
jgi:putative ubiquitin-RnfH superfamily antitoxin RatB of RatAB toxin-antitoxin module